jgi:hypothetical protein
VDAQAPVFPGNEAVEAVVAPDRSRKAGLLQPEETAGGTPRYLAITSCGLGNESPGSPTGWVVDIVGFMTSKVRRCPEATINGQLQLLAHAVTRGHVCWIGQTGVTMSVFGTTDQ